jgi:hypothetical protein
LSTSHNERDQSGSGWRYADTTGKRPGNKIMTIADLAVPRIQLARERAECIRTSLATAAHTYAIAVAEEDWRTLGYATVQEWADAELGPVKWTPEARREIGEYLAAAGFTFRQIAAAEGVSSGTVSDDLTRGRKGGAQKSSTSTGSPRQQAARNRESTRRKTKVTKNETKVTKNGPEPANDGQSEYINGITYRADGKPRPCTECGEGVTWDDAHIMSDEHGGPPEEYVCPKCFHWMYDVCECEGQCPYLTRDQVHDWLSRAGGRGVSSDAVYSRIARGAINDYEWIVQGDRFYLKPYVPLNDASAVYSPPRDDQPEVPDHAAGLLDATGLHLLDDQHGQAAEPPQEATDRQRAEAAATLMRQFSDHLREPEWSPEDIREITDALKMVMPAEARELLAKELTE